MDIVAIKARLAEIGAKIIQMSDSKDLTEDQINEINELHAEHEKLDSELAAKEKMEAIKNKSNTSVRQTAAVTPAAASSTPRVEVIRDRADRFGGFNSIGDFAMSVRRAASGDIDKRFKNTLYEKNGEDGGFLVPEEMSTAIKKKLDDPMESLLARTTQITIGGNNMALPVDETQPWNSGVQAYWVAEGMPITESQGKLSMARWRLHKLGALMKVTDELLDDAPALESYMLSKAPEAIMYKANSAILNGDGVGKPLGLLNSPFGITIAAEAGPAQAADSVVYQNIIKMWSAMIPAARAKSVWLANPGAEEKLMGMQDANGNLIYLSPGSQLNNAPYSLLLGRPVMPMMYGLPAVGDAGDLVLVDLSYYYAIVKAGGIKTASSIHLYFDREVTAFRWTFRIDGSVPFKTPVTTEFGAYPMSGIVKLGDRTGS